MRAGKRATQLSFGVIQTKRINTIDMFKIIGHALYVLVAVLWLLGASTAKMDGTAIDAIPFMILLIVVLPLSIIAWVVFMFDIYELLRKRDEQEDTGIFLPARLFATPFLTMMVIITYARLY